MAVLGNNIIVYMNGTAIAGTRSDEIQVDCDTIETHGFGITKETWAELEIAYKERGLIILTDPDHAGEQIRRMLTEKFPLRST